MGLPYEIKSVFLLLICLSSAEAPGREEGERFPPSAALSLAGGQWAEASPSHAGQRAPSPLGP